MTPGLSLTGRIELGGARLSRCDARDWLARAAVWFESLGDAVMAAEVGWESVEKPVLAIACHPAAEDVLIRATSTGQVRIEASTGLAGPGYHAHLCSMLIQFGEDFDLAWEKTDDTTGYFSTRDFDALTRFFLEQTRAKCLSLHQTASEWGDVPIPLGLPDDHGFTHAGPILTPFGPRTRDWLTRVCEDPTAALELFPWQRFELDADFYRNRATLLLWCEYPWRAPLTDDEGELTDQIAADLASAYALDPTGPFPWREWADVAHHMSADAGRFTVEPISPELLATIESRSASVPACQPLIGYRRQPIWVQVGGGWAVQVPGSFAEGWDDDGRTWYGWDQVRRVVTTLNGEEAISESDFGETIDDCGRRIWRLTGATTGRAPLAYRIDVPTPAERDWAERVSQSFRRFAA